MLPLAALNPLFDILAASRQVYPDLTVAQLQVFLLVAIDPGISQAQIEEKTGLRGGSVSRIVALLSQYGARDKEGLNLINVSQDPNDRRARLIEITPKGTQFIHQMMSLLSYVRGAKDVSPA